MKIYQYICILALVPLTGCSWIFPPTPKEPVLKPGESIVIRTPSGKMISTYVTPWKRQYSWEGLSKTISLDPRLERWNGAIGLYSAGFGGSAFCKLPDGVSRICADEAEMHFNSMNEFIKWRDEYRKSLVYNNSGYAAKWSKSLSREQLNVDVYRILINGKTPTSLPGANDPDVRIIRASMQ